MRLAKKHEKRGRQLGSREKCEKSGKISGDRKLLLLPSALNWNALEVLLPVETETAAKMRSARQRIGSWLMLFSSFSRRANY